MFKDIGNKIKFFAEIVCIIGIFLSVIVGINTMLNKSISNGLLIAVLGTLFSWLAVFALYGFGQLIDNSERIIELLEAKETDLSATTSVTTATVNIPKAPIQPANNNYNNEVTDFIVKKMIENELADLENQLNNGLITQEEFDYKKSELLNQ